MVSKPTFVALTLLLILSSAHAVDFDDFFITIDGLDKSVSEVTYNLVITGNGAETVILSLAEEPKGLNVYDKDTFKDVDYTMSGKELNMNIDFKELDQRRIVIKAYIPNPTEQKNGETLFSIKQDLPREISKFEIIVKLPERAILSDVGDTTLVFPEPTHMLSDGKQIILDWQEELPKESFEIFVTYEMNSKSYMFYLLIFGVIIAIITLVSIVFIVKSNKKMKKVITVGLSKEEKAIYNVIKDKKEISQKEVLQALDYSKPRLSKLIRKLEEKELIEKRPKGRVNILKLKKV